MSKFLDSQGVTNLTKQYDQRYNKKLTNSSVDDGTPDKVVAFDANGNLVKGTVSSIDIGYPAYSSSSTYAIGNIVIYDNKIYQCVTAINVAEAWNALHWNQVAADVNDVVVITSTGEQSNAIANKLKTAKFVNYRGTASGFTVDVLLPLTSGDYQTRIFHLDIFSAASDSASCTQYSATYNILSKTFYITISNKSFVGSVGGMKGMINVSKSFFTNSSTLSLSGKLPYLTTAPTADNTSGFISIVVLDAEPATRYNGYLYIITASAA